MMNNRIRSFIAIPSGKSRAVDSFVSGIRDGLGAENIRWTDPEQCHYTLCFLGDMEREDLKILSDRLALVLSDIPVGYMNITACGFFGRREAPSVLWLGAENDEHFRHIWQLVNDTIEELFPGKGEKRYSPHLTIARIKKLRDSNGFHKIISDAKAAGFSQELELDRVILYKSELKPYGAVYTPLSVFMLKK